MKLNAGMFVAFSLVVGSQAKAERWVVKAPQNKSAAQLSAKGFEVRQQISFGDVTFVTVESKTIAKSKSAAAAEAATLQNLMGAENVAPDFAIGLEAGKPSMAPHAAEAWHVKQMKYTQLPAQANGTGIIVAVVDTGVDAAHPALKDHMWVNTHEIPGNGIDDDNNGFIDDVNGFNFVDKKGDITDTNSHGTHCSGIIAASPKDAANAESAQGVAQGAKIMGVKIIGDGAQPAFVTDAAAGIKYAVDNGANILSNSWRVYKSWTQYGTTPENLAVLKAAIEYAQSKGVIFVAAAGNETKDIAQTQADPLFPVGFTGIANMVGVAASTDAKAPASFTNWGPAYVQVASPGQDIMSTTPNNQWASYSGTSMAGPLVAGSLARGLSAHMTPTEAIESLMTTSDVTTGWETKVKSKGIINLVNYLD